MTRLALRTLLLVPQLLGACIVIWGAWLMLLVLA